jgi:hypothetical protein
MYYLELSSIFILSLSSLIQFIHLLSLPCILFFRQRHRRFLYHYYLIIDLNYNTHSKPKQKNRNALEDGLLEAKAEQAKDKGWNAPAWTNGLIVKPDQAQIKGQVRLWGILSLIGLALPPFIQYSNRFTWLVCIAQLSFRGMPKEQLEGGGIAMSFGGGPGSKSHIKTAWVIGLAVSLAGAFLTYGLMPEWAKGQRMTPFCVYTMRNFLYGTACCYFQPYKNK